MKTEFQHLTDVQLLEEIKRQWYDKDAWDYEKLQQYGSRKMSVADDYFSGDVEEHIASLETEYKSRGLELPDRWGYVNQFRADDYSENYDDEPGFPDLVFCPGEVYDPNHDPDTCPFCTRRQEQGQ